MSAAAARFEEEVTALLERLAALAVEPASVETVADLKLLGQEVDVARALARQERESEELCASAEAEFREARAQQEAVAERARAEQQAALDRVQAELQRNLLAHAELLAAARQEEVEILLTFSRPKIEGYYQARERTLRADHARLTAMADDADRAGGGEGGYLAAAARRARDAIAEELAGLERKAKLIRRATLGM